MSAADVENVQFTQTTVGSVLEHVDALTTPPTLDIFDERVMSFLDVLSRQISANREARKFTDLTALATWLRPSQLQLRTQRYPDDERIRRIGRGVVFHITPNNVPINFAFSAVTGLLAGNSNIVRLPTVSAPQVNILLNLFNEITQRPEFKVITSHLKFVNYDSSNDAITAKLSEICDARVIWGGDETIQALKKFETKPRATDIHFADRYSMLLIDASHYLQNKEDHPRIARNFFNDSYLFDQLACTSPHLVVWLGSEADCDEASSMFWSNLGSVAGRLYLINEISVVDKLCNAMAIVADTDETSFDFYGDNTATIVRVKPAFVEGPQWRLNSGFFLETKIQTVESLRGITDSSFQTLTCFGFSPDSLAKDLHSFGIEGVDRIAKLGSAHEFSFEWDGFDLIRSLSRVRSV